MTHDPARTCPGAVLAAPGERGSGDEMQQEVMLLGLFRRADPRQRWLILRFASQLTA